MLPLEVPRRARVSPMQEWCLLSLGFTTIVIVAASQKYNWGNIGIGWVFWDKDEAKSPLG
jgi:hypothetical protein